MQARGQRHSHRRGVVPFVLAAGVHVRIGVAADDGHRLRSGRTHRHHLQTEAVGHETRLVRAAPARGHQAPGQRAVGLGDGVGPEQLAGGRQRDGGLDDPAVLGQGHVYGPVGGAVGELPCAVEGVDDPHALGGRPVADVGGLLRQHGVVRAVPAQHGGDPRLCQRVADVAEHSPAEEVAGPDPEQDLPGALRDPGGQLGVGKTGTHPPTRAHWRHARAS